jgi:glyoxylase-like metal-dependent hydrolase (beta-lactamase superfamily II)
VALPGRYSVSYLLVAPDGVAVVDVGSTEDVPRLLAALAWLGRAPTDVRFALPTHLHFDHVLGLAAATRELGAPVALGEVAAAQLDGAHPPRWPPGASRLRAFPTWPLQGLPLLARADRPALRDLGLPWSRGRLAAPRGPVLVDGAALSGFPGWRLLATPGHSDEDVALYHEAAGFLVAGDTIRNFLGGEWSVLVADAVAYEATKERLRGLDVRTVFPGHGPLLEGADVVAGLRTRWI